MISQAADARKILTGQELEAFKRNLCASSIYHAVWPQKMPYNEYRQQIILI